MQKAWKVLFSFLFILSLILNFDVNSSLPVYNGEEDIKLPILMYHRISKDKNLWGKYSISPDELESDIKLILSRGFTPITVSDLINRENTPLPEKPIMITFDDGNRSDFLYAYPLALKYKVKIVCSPVGIYTEKLSGSDSHVYLSPEEMREMEKSGFVEFQNHSYNLHNFDSHRKGSLKSSAETDYDYRSLILDDLTHAQKVFRENGLKAPVCFTYPYGMRDDTLLTLVKEAGFTASLGTYARVNILSDNLYDLCRFNRPHNYNINKILDLAE